MISYTSWYGGQYWSKLTRYNPDNNGAPTGIEADIITPNPGDYLDSGLCSRGWKESLNELDLVATHVNNRVYRIEKLDHVQ